jgi:CheY-like chemotaxis protein
MAKPVKVLMVDDDQVQLTIVSAWLGAEGYQVITHNSPFGTNRVVLREQPDVILLDVEMPGLEGHALAEMIGKQDKTGKLSIIFYSGKDQAKLNTLVKECAALGAIKKTNDSKSFLTQFKRLIASVH